MQFSIRTVLRASLLIAALVSTVNLGGQSAVTSQPAAVPAAAATQIAVTVNTLADRHAISPYVYGGSYPQDAAHVTDSGMTVVRWGGNATTNYNWQTHTSNSASDWWFSDYTYPEIGTPDSTLFVTDTIAAGSNPLMTMVMMDWVSKGTAANGTDNGQLYSFSVSKYGAQCTSRPDKADAGNGILAANCGSNPVYVTGNDPHDAYVPLLDTATTPCPASAGNCTGFVNRQDWATALAAAFGSAQHFYDMDNESDIWGGTHRDVHPNPAGYEELRDVYIKQARNVKTWDPAAVRLGPVSCCWWFYWNGANSSDKGAHGNIDMLPWWLNEVYWRDQIDGTRSVDLFDIHAYPDGPDTSSYTAAQKQALTASIYRDYWDPSYVSLSSAVINQIWATSLQPNRTIPFRIPRMRAMVNMIYPGTPLAVTEWSAAFNGESDFSTALADAEGYGILGRENVYLASRWGAPVTPNPNYQTLKLYRNYDGNHSTFGTTSVSATHNADPDLFSVYASLAPSGSPLKMMVVNKDPANTAQVTFTLSNFTPGTVTAYTLSQTSPGAIVASASQPWNATQTFQPYTVTLLVVSGTLPSTPAVEWELNPDAIQVPANGSTTLAPQIVTGSGGVTLASAQFDAGSACAQNGGSMNIVTAPVAPGARGAIAVSPGSVPGFCHFTVTGQDNTGVSQTQGGWIVVGNPAGTLANTTTAATGAPGAQVTLSVRLTPGAAISSPTCSSAAACGPTYAAGASVLFTVDAGSLSGGVYPAASGPRQIAKADSNGVASVQLTLPAADGATVHATAEGPYGLGHPAIQFAETVLASTPPAAPALTSPPNGASGLDTPLTLSWQAAAGAATYKVYFGTAATPPLVSQGITATTYNPGTLGAGVTYYWMIAAVNSAGSTNSAKWSFTTASSGGNPGALRFIPVTPCRVVDTRGGAGPFGGPSMAAGESRPFTIPQSTCGIPATAQAYSLNVTVVPSGPLSYLTLWPSGQSRPNVSTLNSFAGDVVANAAIVPAGAGGAVSVYVTNPTDVILDINGYFDTTTSNSSSFFSVTPCRAVDTRNAAGSFGGPTFAQGQTRDFELPLSGCALPAAASGYALNVTVVPAGYLGYLTTWPAGRPKPVASTLNSWKGKVVANAAIVPAGTNESVSVFASNPTDVILDVNGYFGQAGASGGLSFYPVTPCRVADTRNADGPFGGPKMGTASTRSFTIPASGCGIPATAQAYSLNVTVVPDGRLSYLSAWPAGSGQPFVSTLNSFDGSVVANAAIIPAGTGGAISIYVTNPTHVILDINGYFAP